MAATGRRRKLFQPLEQNTFDKKLVRATAVLDQCLDEALEQLLRLLIVELQEMAKRIHHRVDGPGNRVGDALVACDINQPVEQGRGVVLGNGSPDPLLRQVGADPLEVVGI